MARAARARRETAKILVKDISEKSAQAEDDLAARLLASSPVLEAFGNAKTLRNDNSSRFGKLVTVHFDGSGRIVGAFTRNYLLERTRCAAPPEGERNYHSFYHLVTGGGAVAGPLGLQAGCRGFFYLDDARTLGSDRRARPLIGGGS